MFCWLRSFKYKFKEIFKFLNRIRISNPIENSKPAKPKNINVNPNIKKSSFLDEINITIQYKTNHRNSENSNIDKKLK